MKLTVLTFVLMCHMTLLHQSEAMYGLCSTDWFTEGCYDNNSECKEMGGVCHHGGNHGEGCVCKRMIQRGKFQKYETLTKDHSNNYPFYFRPKVSGENKGILK